MIIKAEAEFDYSADQPDELSFDEGDIITVFNKVLAALAIITMAPGAGGISLAVIAEKCLNHAPYLQEIYPGWAEGEINGRRGVFPNNFVNFYEETVEDVPPTMLPVNVFDILLNFLIAQNIIFTTIKTIE